MVILHLQGCQPQPDGRMKIIRRVLYLVSQIAGERAKGICDREKTFKCVKAHVGQSCVEWKRRIRQLLGESKYHMV